MVKIKSEKYVVEKLQSKNKLAVEKKINRKILRISLHICYHSCLSRNLNIFVNSTMKKDTNYFKVS